MTSDTLTRLIEHHAGSAPATAPIMLHDLPPYLTIKDAADLIAVKPWPIWKMVEDRKLRAVRHSGRILVARHDVEALDAEVLDATIVADD